MTVGTEWIIDALGCNAEKLRDASLLRVVFAEIIENLQLKAVDEMWHQFGGEKGVTGLVLLTESHLACHTYPEHETATFNLYCCRERVVWNWEANLKRMLNAETVKITKIERGQKIHSSTSKSEVNQKSAILNPKSVGGVV